MKAISIKQPWANRILTGEKTLEVRRWRTDYRGPLLICSTQKPVIEPAGYALAICMLDACRAMRPEDEAAACCPFYAGLNVLVLSRLVPLRPPLKCKGALFIWDVNADLVTGWNDSLERGYRTAFQLDPEQS